MIDEIKYIGFYTISNACHPRIGALSAMNKMDYVADTLVKTGHSVHLVSPSWTVNNRVEAQYTLPLSESKRITFCPSIGSTGKLRNYISILLSLSWLFFWLVLKTKKNEKVLVYHSPWLALPVLWAKKIKGFKTILEVEEVYSDVSSLHPFFDRMELKIFKETDSFIFSTELLEQKLNSEDKPYIILYGNYNVPDTVAVPPDDGKIHLLYAGIIDSHKAGAFNAIEAALYLDDNYIMHIIGFGEVDKLLKRIAEINQLSLCKVTYDGVKEGNEYITFCQSCHIGLSTQSTEGSYINSSFPSKILSYLGMGLNVVSCNIEGVKKTKIGALVNYYEDSPAEIAQTVKNMNLLEKAVVKIKIKELDDSFCEKLLFVLKQL